MLVVSSVWLRGSAGGLKDLSRPARLWRIFVTFLGHITARRLCAFVWSFIVDGILHRKLFHESKLRWLAHACMFLGMMVRMTLGTFTWLMTVLAPISQVTQTLVNKNSLTIALIYDGLGLAVVLGVVLAIFRRYVIKDKQLITGQQDTITIVLMGAIFSMGFIVEGARILTTDIPLNPAAFSFVGYLISLGLNLFPIDWRAVYGGLWYIHTGLVTALVAYLPFSKFFHVLISPVVAALNSALKAR
jgi:nitrate reductase gamma subunit